MNKRPSLNSQEETTGWVSNMFMQSCFKLNDVVTKN